MRTFQPVRALAQAVSHKLLSGRPQMATRDAVIGKHVRFGRDVVIRSRRVRIGDGVTVGDGVRIDADVFEIGDYGSIYHGCFVPGPGELTIGHNFWLGAGSIVDAKGGTTIGNNVCVGAHSQLWTHMEFGDVMAGCRFHSKRSMRIGDDAWLGAHCLVSPVNIGERSLVLFGSLVTKDIPSDRTFAGSPAADVTDRFGPQFAPTGRETRIAYLRERIDEFGRARRIPDIRRRIVIVDAKEDLASVPLDRIGFDVMSRTYTKRRTPLESDLMRFLLPSAKFVPSEER